jgi:hypothetical protein
MAEQQPNLASKSLRKRLPHTSYRVLASQAETTSQAQFNQLLLQGVLGQTPIAKPLIHTSIIPGSPPVLTTDQNSYHACPPVLSEVSDCSLLQGMVGILLGVLLSAMTTALIIQFR